MPFTRFQIVPYPLGRPRLLSMASTRSRLLIVSSHSMYATRASFAYSFSVWVFPYPDRPTTIPSPMYSWQLWHTPSTAFASRLS